MYELPVLIPYGFIRKLHGHQGEMVVELLSEDLFDAEPEYLFLEIEGIPVPFAVESLRGDISRLILKLDRVDSEEEASAYRGCKVLVSKSDLSTHEFETDEDDDIIGFNLIHPEDGPLGVVSDIDDTTENVLLLIKQDRDGADIILPLVEDWIVSVNEDTREIVYDYPPGLIVL